MQPPPLGVWGMPAEILGTLPGYGPDIGKNREEARNIMKKAGYGADKRLAVKVSVRNTPPFRDPAIILIDQLREVYIDAELDAVESLFNGWRMEDVWLEKKPTSASAAAEPSRPAAAEKPALVPPSMPSGDSRTGAASPEPPAVSTPAPASHAETGDNPPKSPKPQSEQQALEPEKRQIASRQTPPVADKKEQLDPTVRDLITRGWELYYLPYSAVTWQDARRNFERAFELDSRSTQARIGLASILSAKLADGWSPVLQEDLPRAENILAEALDRGTASNRAAAHFTLGVLRQMQNRLPEAQKEFETAVSLDPSNARAQLHLGETRLFLGEPEAGIAPLEQAIRLAPDGPNLAIAYWAVGTWQL